MALFRFAATTLLAGITTSAPTMWAGSICGCPLSADWAGQGYAAGPGFDAGVRFEYVDQTRLRSGHGVVGRNAFDVPNAREIQLRPLNRNTWLDLNSGFDAHWAAALSLPVHDRFHTTIAEDTAAPSTSRITGMGDLRLLARWRDERPARTVGLQFGFKLPTGRTNQPFAAGPAAGESLDRGLQHINGLQLEPHWILSCGLHFTL